MYEVLTPRITGKIKLQSERNFILSECMRLLNEAAIAEKSDFVLNLSATSLPTIHHNE